MPAKKAKKKPPFSLRLPDELREKLQKIADKEDRPIGYIIIKALERWAARQK
jgi:predicted transcriptional regulator